MAGLKPRGLEERAVVMLHTPDGICPNVGVEEPRIREILAKDWEAAGCRVHTPKEMLKALESGACGGDGGVTPSCLKRNRATGAAGCTIGVSGLTLKSTRSPRGMGAQRRPS